MFSAKLAVTAVISLAIGAGGTYATMHVTATCSTADTQDRAASDTFTKQFFAKPPLPTTGYSRY